MENQLIMQAKDFAKLKHKSQIRKMSGEPYINHPIKVSQRVAQFTDNPIIIAAALLHDVLEDTKTTEDELLSNFPSEVVDIVKELTLDKSHYHVPKNNPDGIPFTEKEFNERKLQLKAPYIINKLAHLSKYARLIKFADREDNVSDLSTATDVFASRYARETKIILDSIDFSLDKSEKIIITSILKKIQNFLP